MKKLILACLMLGSMPILSHAQSEAAAPQSAPQQQTARPAVTPELIAERRTTMLKQQLGLSDEQYKNVYQVELETTRKQQSMRPGANAGGPNEMQQLMASHNEQIKKMLTPEQAAKFEKMMPPMARPLPANSSAVTPVVAPAAH